LTITKIAKECSNKLFREIDTFVLDFFSLSQKPIFLPLQFLIIPQAVQMHLRIIQIYFTLCIITFSIFADDHHEKSLSRQKRLLFFPQYTTWQVWHKNFLNKAKHFRQIAIF